VDEGFFMMVKSQISQKAVAAYSEMESKQIALLQLAKALDGVKRQMENDYSMITKRYAKLFQSLDRELAIRVKELDRPAMHLAETKKGMVFDKLKDDSSMLFCVSAEALPIAQTALSGKLKQKTREALVALVDSIEESNSYSEKIESILVKIEGAFSNASDRHYLPAIFFATDSLLSSGDYIENVFAAQTDAWHNTASVVSQISREHNDLNWNPQDSGEKNKIRREFLALCEKELSEERVSKEAIRLFDESAWQECAI
jgi:hypothetical protein